MDTTLEAVLQQVDALRLAVRALPQDDPRLAMRVERLLHELFLYAMRASLVSARAQVERRAAGGV